MSVNRFAPGHVVTPEMREKMSKAQLGPKNHMFGKKMSLESREKMSRARCGRKLSPEHIEKVRQFHLGRKRSAETRMNMSLAMKGRKKSPESIERRRLSNLGQRRTLETRARMRLAALGKINSPEARAKMSRAHRGLQVGEKHPNWRGGISKLPYALGFTKSLKAYVRARDGFACFICSIGENGKAHDVHHIDYDKMNHAPGNLVTLCQACHKKTNFRREAWHAYFSNGEQACL